MLATKSPSPGLLSCLRFPGAQLRGGHGTVVGAVAIIPLLLVRLGAHNETISFLPYLMGSPLEALLSILHVSLEQ